MDKFIKIHYQPQDKLLRWEVMPNKSAQKCPRRWYVKLSMAGEAPLPFLTAHSTRVVCIFTLVLTCETFANSSDKQVHLLWGITEPFVLGDEMTESGGLVRLLTSRSQHDSWARLRLSEVTKGTIVPFDPSAFSATDLCHSLPGCKIIKHFIVCQNWVFTTLFKW